MNKILLIVAIIATACSNKATTKIDNYYDDLDLLTQDCNSYAIVTNIKDVKLNDNSYAHLITTTDKDAVKRYCLVEFETYIGQNLKQNHEAD